MATLTDEEAIDLNVRVEATLGDDLSCFDNSGKEVGRRLYTALDTMPIELCRAIRLTMPYIQWPREVWYQRNGQPWQVDIEAHVAAWRAPARPFATDDALALTLLKKARLTVSPDINGWMAAQCDCGSTELRKRMVGCQSGWHTGATIAETVTRAYLAVAEGRELHPPA